MKKNISKQNIGNAGEYYVAAILSALNFVVTITLGRAERYDIISVSPKGKVFKFSVKTRLLKEKRGFPLSEKDEEGSENDLYYFLIRINEFKEEPDYWIIPSKRISEVISSSHFGWKKDPKKNGTKRKDSSIRRLPITLVGQEKIYFPKNWDKEMQSYYKNLDVLK